MKSRLMVLAWKIAIMAQNEKDVEKLREKFEKVIDEFLKA